MVNLKFHRILTKDKWDSFPFFKQILMIANELNRANNWIEKKDFAEVKLCYERAFELLYLTVETLKDRRKLREILRFKEILANLYNEEAPSLEENKNLLKVLVLLDKDSFSVLRI